MTKFRLISDNIGKSYSIGSNIFSGINLELTNRSVYGIIGKNGSGKTTLLKILSTLITASKGKTELIIGEQKIEREAYYRYISYVAPYINLYEEFTPLEHLKLSAELSGEKFDKDKALRLLDEFELEHKKNHNIQTFSSGMKQRMKYCSALLIEKPILFLDEPFTNLDNFGIGIIERLIESKINSEGGIMIASNDLRELNFCDKSLNINDYKN